MQMKVLAATVLLGSSSFALAADPGMPMAELPVDWAGGYVGIFGGASHARTRATDITGEEFGNNDPGDSYTGSGTSGFLGGTAGYNWQNGSLVFGGEIEAGYMFNDHLWQFDEGESEDPAILTEYGLYGVAAARLGYAVDRVLLYGKAGGAVARIRSAAGEYDGVGNEGSDGKWGFDGDEAGFGNKTRFGYAIGGGVEWAATNEWTVKAEYLYMDFGSETYDGRNGDSPFEMRDSLHTFKIGLNRKF